MTYLLDTNVIIDILHGNPTVLGHLRKETLQECCMTDITLYELYYGANLSSNPDGNIELIDRLAMSIAVLATTNYMKEAARQKAMLKASGNLLEDFDIIIGCAAKVNDLTLVTGNMKHMCRLYGVSVDNWRI